MKNLILSAFLAVISFSCGPKPVESQDSRLEKIAYYEQHPDFGNGPEFMDLQLKIIEWEELPDGRIKCTYQIKNPLLGGKEQQLTKVYTFRDGEIVGTKSE